MDALEALDDGEDDEGSSEPSSSSGGGDGDDGGVKQADGAPQSAAPPPAKRAKASTITLEDLQAQGYSGGPSVLAMRPPTEDAAPANWTWCVSRTMGPPPAARAAASCMRPSVLHAAEHASCLSVVAACFSLKARTSSAGRMVATARQLSRRRNQPRCASSTAQSTAQHRAQHSTQHL
jgi:hypothetical protein